jgi:hypothetical protein
LYLCAAKNGLSRITQAVQGVWGFEKVLLRIVTFSKAHAPREVQPSKAKHRQAKY